MGLGDNIEFWDERGGWPPRSAATEAESASSTEDTIAGEVRPTAADGIEVVLVASGRSTTLDSFSNRR